MVSIMIENWSVLQKFHGKLVYSHPDSKCNLKIHQMEHSLPMCVFQAVKQWFTITKIGNVPNITEHLSIKNAFNHRPKLFRLISSCEVALIDSVRQSQREMSDHRGDNQKRSVIVHQYRFFETKGFLVPLLECWKRTNEICRFFDAVVIVCARV